jgi:CRP-like cAMP-binding protein
LPQTLEPLLRGHAFFADVEPGYVSLLVGCATNVVFPDGAFIFKEGASADTFFLIREGRLSLEIAVPGRGTLVVQTLGPGDVAGFSWLVEPHRWSFDGRVIDRVRAIQMDGACLRGKCEEDPRLGYELMRRCAALASHRLSATQLQLLDVYGHAGA